MLSKKLSGKFNEVLVHTGQHYDYGMSQVFFDELELREPDYNLGVGSGSHGWQTGNMLIKIEEVLLKEEPDFLLIYGDTNSTIAGALAAAKLKIPAAHVEAGLRSFTQIPEEINRVVSDHLSTLLFCPTRTALLNLKKEGISNGVHWVGDVMFDSLVYFSAKAGERGFLEKLSLKPKEYILITLHREENTDNSERLQEIVSSLVEIEETIVFPMHPRTLKVLTRMGWKDKIGRNVKIIEPVGYLDMILLEKEAKMILTDSGGVQKEAYMLGIPCVTLREETEWVETVEAGWNMIAGRRGEKIIQAAKNFKPAGERPDIFGKGNAAEKIAEVLWDYSTLIKGNKGS
ncbi:MAG: UDP-N-acetylglucosamine 2-epimerase (non-hydrolyzing) [Firmicutes bacterium]|nr:UDP-N-acetylglucosamine 2-epimerase (non-hydrolyzing) [Bacillota bacterium]